MVHQWDSCCFQAGNLHPNISHYNGFVQSQIADGKSWFQTSANLGNYHEINYREYRRPQAVSCCLWSVDLAVYRPCGPHTRTIQDL